MLTELLLPTFRGVKQGRIINGASGAHRRGSLDFGDLWGKTTYAGWPAYCQSKLMNMMSTNALPDRLADTATTANCLRLGFVRSKFGHNKSGFTSLVLRLSQIVLAISPEAGPKTLLCLATAPELVDISRQYFDKSRPCHPRLRDEIGRPRNGCSRLAPNWPPAIPLAQIRTSSARAREGYMLPSHLSFP